MTKQPERIKVKETCKIDTEFEGKLEDIIAMLQDWMNEGGWEGIEVEYYYESTTYYLYKYRPETDEEYERRMEMLKWEEERKLKEKDKRRQLYEQLKKEFGDD